MTHDSAVRMVRGARNLTRRKVGNNTYASVLDDGSVGVTLHATMVVVIHPDDCVTLNSGGWRTVTTKARMNDYCGNRIYQRRHQWYVRIDGQDVPFVDYMTIPSHRVRDTQAAAVGAA